MCSISSRYALYTISFIVVISIFPNKDLNTVLTSTTSSYYIVIVYTSSIIIVKITTLIATTI